MNFHWMNGIDFKSLLIHTSSYMDNTTPFVARFNNSEIRELYDLFRRRGGASLK